MVAQETVRAFDAGEQYCEWVFQEFANNGQPRYLSHIEQVKDRREDCEKGTGLLVLLLGLGIGRSRIT